MLPAAYYQSALVKNQTPVVPEGEASGPGDPDEKKPISPTNPSPNFTYTKDPNVVIGKYGLKITPDDMANANKNGMDWRNFSEFAHWYGGNKKAVDYNDVAPYYRTYPNGQIDGRDIAVLKAQGDPKIDAILNRNIAKPGEVPLFGTDDSDLLKQLVAAQKKPTVDYMSLVKSVK